MKFTVRLLGIIYFSAFIFPLSAQIFSRPVIIDHTCVDISAISPEYIQKARRDFRIAYGHTSHGSQIVSGMKALEKASALYRFNRSGSNGALSFWDCTPKGDLGNPNRTEWAARTRELLKGKGKDRNVVMWSWCGQVGSASEADIDTYLKLMSQLEKEFPSVIFVYMTGHLDGTGSRGNLCLRNEQIRKYCKKRKKVLFDFADIESFAPGDKTNYMKLNGRDSCDYRKGRTRGNWADEWIEKHPNHGLALPGSAAHTRPLNGALKGRAFWRMLAQLSGWRPPAIKSAALLPIKRSTYTPSNLPSSSKASRRTSPSTSREISKTYKFDCINDYRDWIAKGTDKSIIPRIGKGLDIPRGKPAVAMLNYSFLVKELEFKARVIDGDYVNWYINCDWDGSWRPKKGIGGIINSNGCMLTINGKTIKIRRSPKIDKLEHHYQISVKNGKLIWGMDGKVIVEQSLPQNVLTKGKMAIGAWNSNIRIDGVYVKGSE